MPAPVTPATMVHLISALAVTCPDAASPSLLRALWRALGMVMHAVSPGEAAALARAAGRLRATPPPRLAAALCRHVASIASEATLPQLAALLLEAWRAGWQLEATLVQSLADMLLSKHADALRQSQLHAVQQQQQQQQLVPAVHTAAETYQMPLADGLSTCDRTAVPAGVRGCLAATSAAAAWSHTLPRASRHTALELCGTSPQLSLLTRDDQLPRVAAAVCRLASGGAQRGAAWVQPPHSIAKLLWINRHKLPAEQQALLSHCCWRGAGLPQV